MHVNKRAFKKQDHETENVLVSHYIKFEMELISPEKKTFNIWNEVKLDFIF